MPTTISIPEDLADELYEMKERGESYADVIRRLKRQAARAESETPSEPSADPTPSPRAEQRRETDAQTAPETPDEEADVSVLIDRVADETLPGRGQKLEERREAFRAVVDYLRDEGTVTPAEFRSAVYPDHPARYTDGQNPARSWWKNAMYPALADLADRTDAVERADHTGEWRWRGED